MFVIIGSLLEGTIKVKGLFYEFKAETPWPECQWDFSFSFFSFSFLHILPVLAQLSFLELVTLSFWLLYNSIWFVFADSSRCCKNLGIVAIQCANIWSGLNYCTFFLLVFLLKKRVLAVKIVLLVLLKGNLLMEGNTSVSSIFSIPLSWCVQHTYPLI